MFLESIDLYAKSWSKREQVELKYISEWKDQLKELVADRTSDLKGHFKSPECKVLNQHDMKDTLHKLPANYVLVPTNKAANNVIIVCKKYHIDNRDKNMGLLVQFSTTFTSHSSTHNSHIASEPLSLSNCIKLWGKLVLLQYGANIWC